MMMTIMIGIGNRIKYRNNENEFCTKTQSEVVAMHARKMLENPFVRDDIFPSLNASSNT